MKNPLVSIIMSEYNTDANLLLDSINSIINQTYKNFELIIVDDCSKNNVKEIVDNLNDERITIIKNSTNLGLSRSLNKAAKEAKGKYIARMDTDDISYPNRIKIEVDYLEKHEEIKVVGSNVEFYDGNKIWGSSNIKGLVDREQILKSSPFFHPTVMMRKEVFKKYGPYPNYDRCEDYALWIKIFCANQQMYNLEDKLVRYHLSLSDYKKRSFSKRKGIFKMIKNHYTKYLKPNKNELLRIYLKNIISSVIPGKIMYLRQKIEYKEKQA